MLFFRIITGYLPNMTSKLVSFVAFCRLFSSAIQSAAHRGSTKYLSIRYCGSNSNFPSPAPKLVHPHLWTSSGAVGTLSSLLEVKQQKWKCFSSVPCGWSGTWWEAETQKTGMRPPSTETETETAGIGPLQRWTGRVSHRSLPPERQELKGQAGLGKWHRSCHDVVDVT